MLSLNLLRIKGIPMSFQLFDVNYVSYQQQTDFELFRPITKNISMKHYKIYNIIRRLGNL